MTLGIAINRGAVIGEDGAGTIREYAGFRYLRVHCGAGSDSHSALLLVQQLYLLQVQQGMPAEILINFILIKFN